MKKEVKKESRVVISQLVLGLIKSKGLARMDGKDAAKVLLPAVRKAAPGSKFKLSHVYWYLGRYRRQQKAKKPVDHLVQMRPAK